jgi:putative colanic acid biosynthesis acetyltransferase WcaF
MKTMRLNTFKKGDYNPGSLIRRVLWYIVSRIFFQTCVPWPSVLKVKLLRYFGATVGKGLNIKPHVQIKYPWFLTLGDSVWIGEHVWIDSIAEVSIGSHSCISQGALLLTGSHDYSLESFDLKPGSISIEEGVWICARSIVCPGVCCKLGSVLTAGSVATRDLEAHGVYQGNPAVKKRERTIRD